MRILGRFALVLVVLGSLLGWIVRSRRGTRPGRRYWWGTFAPAAVHAAYVVQRAWAAPLEPLAIAAFGVGSVALLVGAGLAVRALARHRRGWSALVPVAHALAHALATSALGPAFSAASAAPPSVGPALVVGWSIVASAAWGVVLLPAFGRGRRRRTGGGTDAPARLDP